MLSLLDSNKTEYIALTQTTHEIICLLLDKDQKHIGTKYVRNTIEILNANLVRKCQSLEMKLKNRSLKV
jgi:hypothetical protein